MLNNPLQINSSTSRYNERTLRIEFFANELCLRWRPTFCPVTDDMYAHVSRRSGPTALQYRMRYRCRRLIRSTCEFIGHPFICRRTIRTAEVDTNSIEPSQLHQLRWRIPLCAAEGDACLRAFERLNASHQFQFSLFREAKSAPRAQPVQCRIRSNQFKQ